MKINDISARKVIASMGDYTVEATIEFDEGIKSTASVPAGISAGKYEVKKVDAEQGMREIGEMRDILVNKDWVQESLDQEIASRGFGGNATLAVSAAFFKATFRLTLPALRYPKLMLLLFEGGEHGNANITIQEFMAVEDSLEQAMRDFKTLKEALEEKSIEHIVGAEGGFSPKDFNNYDVLDTIKSILPNTKIALDVAGTFRKDGQELDYSLLFSDYSLVSVEDPYGDEDWEKWTEFTKTYGEKILVVGDDLVTTDKTRIQKAIDTKAINAVILKPNQIGTITGAIEAAKTAKAGGLKTIVSHRGQETDDAWIADFALAVEADYVKFGGMDRGERIAKYNRLIELGMK